MALRIAALEAIIRVDSSNLDNLLCGRFFQKSDHFWHRRYDRTYSESKTFQAAPAVRVSHVVQARPADRGGFVGIFELVAVVGQQNVELGGSRVAEQRDVLLLRPAQSVDVVNGVRGEHVPEQVKHLDRRIRVEQNPHQATELRRWSVARQLST
jgi:hypothetical protein